MAEHGYGKYTNGGCRCDVCRQAMATYQRAARARRAALPERQIPHGTVNGYANYDCRCDSCAAAKRAANREFRERCVGKAAA